LEKLEPFISCTIDQNVVWEGKAGIIVDWRSAEKAKIRFADGHERWVSGSEAFKAYVASKVSRNQIHQDLKRLVEALCTSMNTHHVIAADLADSRAREARLQKSLHDKLECAKAQEAKKGGLYQDKHTFASLEKQLSSCTERSETASRALENFNHKNVFRNAEEIRSFFKDHGLRIPRATFHAWSRGERMGKRGRLPALELEHEKMLIAFVLRWTS
jgi:hypothetical protein